MKYPSHAENSLLSASVFLQLPFGFCIPPHPPALAPNLQYTAKTLHFLCPRKWFPGKQNFQCENQDGPGQMRTAGLSTYIYRRAILERSENRMPPLNAFVCLFS
jgi:hypothetical protein